MKIESDLPNRFGYTLFEKPATLRKMHDMSSLPFLLPNNSAVFGGLYIMLIITNKELDIAQID